MSDKSLIEEQMGERPWPKKGDALFRQGDTRTDAWIHPMDVNFTIYADLYMKGAENLLHSITPGRRDEELLIYPILFLFRHHVELQVKYILSVWCDYEEEDFGQKYGTHNLKYLWDECRKVLDEVFPGEDDEATDAVEEMILELNEIDPQSMSFRYPINKKGEISFGEERFFSWENLYLAMQKMSNYFDGVSVGIGDYYDQMRDIRGYYGP